MINNNIIVLGIGGGGANIVNYLSTKINDVAEKCKLRIKWMSFMQD